MIVCMDSNCVIYLIEGNPVFGPKVAARIAAGVTRGETFAACDLVRAECLAYPILRQNARLIAEYATYFTRPDVAMLPMNAIVCERAARIRAESGMSFKTPDALHLAAAIEHGCGLFLTNDAQLARCQDIPVEVLV